MTIQRGPSSVVSFSVFVMSLALMAATRMSAQIAYTVFPVSVETNAQPVNTTLHVSLALQDSTVRYAVSVLARQAHLHPIFTNSPVLSHRVTVHMADVNVMDAFAKVLQGTGLEAVLSSNGEMVMIRERSNGGTTGSAQVMIGNIAGRVTDSASGQGLGGASVKVAGTRLSTVTSDSGNFTLRNVPAGEQVLSVRLFGYKPTERTVTVVDSQRTIVRIVLVSVPTVLADVVTTATGTQRKIEVGNDITTLNVDSIMQVAPVTSLTDILETRVPGLTVLHSSGTPGDPSRIRLRGASSILLDNDPIVIVDGVRVYASQSDTRNRNLAYTPGATANNEESDGVSTNGPLQGGQISVQKLIGGFSAPSPLDQIDPNSIETIEVLKGPSATATYGSDAAAGVIVITTKHGRVGPTHWSLALGDGVNWNPGKWPVNYYRFGYNGSGINSQTDGLCPWFDLCAVDSVVAFQALNDPRYTLFSHGSNQTANLTISGGLPTLTYSLTGSGAGDVGLLKLPAIEQARYDSVYGPIPNYLVRPDNYTTWGASGQLTVLPSPKFRVTLQSSLFNSTQQQSSLDNAVLQLEGEYISPSLLVGPLVTNELERATSNAVTSTNAVSVHWQLRPWLPLDVTGGINSIDGTDNTYLPYGVAACGVPSTVSYNGNNCGGTGAAEAPDTTGFYGIARKASRDQTLNVGTQIPLRLATLALGGNLFSQSTNDLSAYASQLAPGVSVPTTFPIPAGVSTAPVSLAVAGQSTYGWYVEPTLNLKSRFFASPGFRFDGGSGASHSAGSVDGLSAFPKLSLSYVAVDRQGQAPLWGILTLLRPRMAFGLAGIQPNPATQLRLFNVGTGTTASNGIIGQQDVCGSTVSLNGTTLVSAVCLDQLGNTQLRPERSQELEGGMDVTLWRGRLSLAYTQYNKTTKDAILNIPVAPSVFGSSTYFKNIGEIRNTGTEIDIRATVLESRVASWNVGVNLSNDNSLLVRLNPGQQPICYGSGDPCQGVRLVPGYPVFGVWAQPIAGFADANHDGLIEPNEIRYGDSAVYVGQPNAKYQFNFNTGLALFSGRLTVNATVAYQNGLTQINDAACASNAFALVPNNPATPLSTQAAVVAANCGVGALNVSVNRVGQSLIGLAQTVNTLRFNDLSINYNVPRSVSSWFRAPRMVVAVQGSNLGLHTNYRGLDPDVNAFSTVSSADETVDLGQLPEPRTWWLKLMLGN